MIQNQFRSSYLKLFNMTNLFNHGDIALFSNDLNVIHENLQRTINHLHLDAQYKTSAVLLTES